ncbi:MAG: DUF1493 family protein [Chitinophagaceae bacterium]|nr:DUF1493 family protein [Chitinophagaceae bacterium]MBP8114979.1 DUF1493 family protein [Chitinophagaceae bacterium]
MEDKLLKDIIVLIEAKMGRYATPITRATCLEKDLGITGDDAGELLLEYGQKFNIDVSKLNLRKYFTPEGDTILQAILRMITGKKASKDSELTVGDLEKGVIARRLDEEVINS